VAQGRSHRRYLVFHVEHADRWRAAGSNGKAGRCLSHPVLEASKPGAGARSRELRGATFTRGQAPAVSDGPRPKLCSHLGFLMGPAAPLRESTRCTVAHRTHKPSWRRQARVCSHSLAPCDRRGARLPPNAHRALCGRRNAAPSRTAASVSGDCASDLGSGPASLVRPSQLPMAVPRVPRGTHDRVAETRSRGESGRRCWVGRSARVNEQLANGLVCLAPGAR